MAAALDKNSYYSVISKLGISNFLAISAKKRDRLTEDTILNTIFYSSAIEGNRLDKDVAFLLLNNGFIELKGRLSDYFELSNHKKLYEYMLTLKSDNLTYDDVINVHDLLFDGIIGYTKGQREVITTISSFIVEPPGELKDEIKRTLQYLNTEPESPESAFINALNFHLDFVTVHPFEDGNGRVVRLLLNYYLLKNGMPPLYINIEDKPLYFNSLAAMHLTNYQFGFLAAMTYFYTRHNESELVKTLRERRKDYADDSLSLALADSILVFSKAVDNEELDKDIRFLYSSGDAKVKQSALWLSVVANRSFKDIIKEALSAENEDVRMMGLFAIENIFCKRSKADFEAYYPLLRNIALKDASYKVRSEAFYMISRRGGNYLDKDLAERISKEGEPLRLPLLNALKNLTNAELVKILVPYLSSGSKDVRWLAYEGIVSNAPQDKIPLLIGDITKLEDEIKSVIIRKLAIQYPLTDGPKLNSDEVALWLSAAAKRDSVVKGALLYTLAQAPQPNSIYTQLLEAVIGDENANVDEKAYAIYVLGMLKGYNYLNKEYDLSISKDRPLKENTAIFLTIAHEPNEKLIEVFNVGDNELDLVGLIEIKKAIEGNAFGTRFLSLCKTRWARWR